MTVIAAGALLWRERKGKLEVALVHRARYDDYSWPKGKQDEGETLVETAVREIREETGLKVRLGVKLGVQRYQIGSKGQLQDKEVHYWAARVSTTAADKAKFTPNEEVAAVLWLNPEDAAAKLSYAHDLEFLKALVEMHAKGLLHTKPLLLLRHGKATPRSDWTKADGKRPLLPEGKRQAEALVGMLAAFGPKRVVTSPWVRCRSTVEPFATKRKRTIIERHQLSELGNQKGPDRTAKVVNALIGDGRSSVICSHRPALPTILAAIAKRAGKELVAEITGASNLNPGEFIVIHMARPVKDKPWRVVGVERHEPLRVEAASEEKPA